MKYRITARTWKLFGNDWHGLQDRFGEDNSEHELSDAEVIQIIMQFGRAEIVENKDKSLRFIEFQNDYD